MNKKVLCIGDAFVSLVDKNNDGNLKSINYQLNVDGSATKVACAIGRLGGEVKMLSKIGFDNFGQMIYDTYVNSNVDTENVFFDEELHTGIKFEHQYGDRISKDCYCKYSANHNLKLNDLSEDILDDVYILHFNGQSLLSVRTRKVLNHLIRNALLREITISFDVDFEANECCDFEHNREVMVSYLNVADIVRVSSKDFETLTGTSDVQEGLETIFEKGVKKVIYTMGESGVRIYYCDNTYLKVKGVKAIVNDKRGVREAFIGSYLYFVSQNQDIDDKVRDYIATLLANKCAAYACEGEGAITAYITNEDIMK